MLNQSTDNTNGRLTWQLINPSLILLSFICLTLLASVYLSDTACITPFASLHYCCIPCRSHLSTLSTFNIAGEDTEFKRHQSSRMHLPSPDVVTEDEKIKLLGPSNALLHD